MHQTEVPIIYFLQLVEGKVIVCPDMLSLQKINTKTVNRGIINLVVANKSFLYGLVSPRLINNSASFNCGSHFNGIYWNTIQVDQ
jgi:hypothetical protein